MKKAFCIFLSLLTLAVSCQKELNVPGPEPEAVENEGTVTIRFNVNAPENSETKAMKNQPNITHLYVAVFGGSGYLKEYVRAEPVALADHERTDAADTTHEYAYQVKLSLTRSRIRVHFIANGPTELPFDYEATVIGQLTTSGTQDAYWQKVILPNGIYALDDAGSHQTPPVYTVDPDFDLVDGEHIMAKVPLIRNFAKITITSEAANLTVKSFAVVNVPTHGTVAPYNTNTGEFIMNYADYMGIESLSAVYPGNMPTGTVIEKVIPDSTYFQQGGGGVALASSADPNVYMYERPKPDANASFLLLYANYKDNDKYKDGIDCYYKIDLMDKGEYLPIYRNFRYNIKIKSVYRPGKNNPTSAANGAGSGDISSDTETASLENVSDGQASISVSFTESTYTDQGEYSVKFRYVPDISTGAVANDSVTFELLSAGSTGAAIVSNSLRKAAADDSHDTYRELFFTTTEISNVQKTQKIRIIGTSTKNGRTSRLYREVLIRLMQKQTMTLSCSPSSIDEEIGEPVDLIINLPKDLPASIFPLQFKIEAEKLSLTPNNDNLPVQSDTSIISGNSKPTFQFIKTLSREDYLAYQEAATGNTVPVPCHFKTNVAKSASNIYVENTYFHTASTSFGNYIKRYFTQMRFDKNAAIVDEPVDFSFIMDWEHYATEDQEFPEFVYVTLNGLIPDDDETRLIQTSGSTYRFTVNPATAMNVQTLHLVANGLADRYGVTLAATHYQTETYLAPRNDFENLQFNSTPFYGNGWPVTVSFTIPSSYQIPASPGYIDIELGLTNLERNPSDANIWVDNNTGKLYYRATSTGAKTMSLLTTGNRTANTAVTMTHPDYNTGNLDSGRQYVTIPAQNIQFTGNNNSAFYNNTVNLYSDNNYSTSVGSFTGTRSGGVTNRKYWNGAFTFSAAVDYGQTIYMRYVNSGWFSTTTYTSSATAGAMYNGTTCSISSN